MSRKQTFNSMNFKVPFNKPIVEKFHPMGKKGKFFREEFSKMYCEFFYSLYLFVSKINGAKPIHRILLGSLCVQISSNLLSIKKTDINLSTLDKP